MKAWRAIAGAAALEIVSDPLALLLTAGSVSAVAFACVLHVHQFGEPARMARDASLSVFLVSSVVYGVFCTIKAFRREVESGTLQMALARPVSRKGFFLSKACGCFAACAFFMLTLAPVAFMAVLGAETGGAIAVPKGDVARIWGPALLAIALCAVFPLAAAAFLDRFFRFRFAASASRIAFAFSWIAAFSLAAFTERCGVAPGAAAEACKMFPALAMLVMPALLFTFCAAAAAARLKANAAASLCAILFAVFLPALGNYYLSDALAGGGTIPWSRVALAAAATAPLVAAAIAAGARGDIFRDAN